MQTKGRLGSEGNLALFGISELPVISGDTRLAHLILTEYHEGQYNVNYREVVDTVARSRPYAYIAKGLCTAKRICANCPLCILKEAKVAGQKMGNISSDRLVLAPPFSNVTADDCISPRSGLLYIYVISLRPFICD